MATTEQLEDVAAGRELDALIESAVFGNPTHQASYCCTFCWVRDDGEQIPNYSTKIADAWLVFEWLGARRAESGGGIGLHANGTFVVYAGSAADDTSAETAPLAICKAALKAARSQTPALPPHPRGRDNG